MNSFALDGPNQGFKARAAHLSPFSKNSREVHLLGTTSPRRHPFLLKRLLLNSVDLRIKLIRASDAFCLMGQAADSTFHLTIQRTAWEPLCWGTTVKKTIPLSLLNDFRSGAHFTSVKTLGSSSPCSTPRTLPTNQRAKQCKKINVTPIYVINLLISDLIQLCCMIIQVARPRGFGHCVKSSIMIYFLWSDCPVLASWYLVEIAWPLWYRFRRTIKSSVVVCVVVWALTPSLFPHYPTKPFWNIGKRKQKAKADQKVTSPEKDKMSYLDTVRDGKQGQMLIHVQAQSESTNCLVFPHWFCTFTSCPLCFPPFLIACSRLMAIEKSAGLFEELLTLDTWPAKLQLFHLPSVSQALAEPKPQLQPQAKQPHLQPAKPQLTSTSSHASKPRALALLGRSHSRNLSQLSPQPAPACLPSKPAGFQPASKLAAGFQPASKPPGGLPSLHPNLHLRPASLSLSACGPASSLSQLPSRSACGPASGSSVSGLEPQQPSASEPSQPQSLQPPSLQPQPQPDFQAFSLSRAQLEPQLPAFSLPAFSLRPSFWVSSRRVLQPVASSAAGSPAASPQPSAPETELEPPSEPPSAPETELRQ
ncbi:hypothetical protein L3Q82_001872 [Scortum barcoo]|uniref:Uncharacterized protein n=1 Tax=Scortum barcoo TaxID=214431 RepID=A0ACB8W4Q0_9TELE|nr:hypothetical protein L3Q82_001872 [Scortum barcoo]